MESFHWREVYFIRILSSKNVTFVACKILYSPGRMKT